MSKYKGKNYDPLAISLDPYKCIHVEVEELSEGVVYNRCNNGADRHFSPNGFLCHDHQRLLDYDHARLNPVSRVRRDLDSEIIDSIIQSENRIISECVRISVKTDSKGGKIEFAER